MKLKSYLAELTADERESLANRCHTSVGHLKNVAHGSRQCGESLAIDLDRETRGKVTCEDLRPDVDWAHLRESSRRISSLSCQS